MFNFFHADLNSGIRSSVNCFGVFPAFLAVSAIFLPWSSVPVRRKTSLPLSLFHLAMMSAAIVV